MHGKKNSAGAGKVSKEGEGNPTRNGKVVPFGPKTGQFRKQRKEGVRDQTEKKLLDQIEIPFPQEDGVARTARKFAWCSHGCAQGNTCGARLGACITTNGTDKKREERIAAENK